MPPPPSCTARRVQEAGSTTRKLMERPFELVSVGAIAPSMEQYAGGVPAATHRGAASVTPATGSPIDETGIVVPSRACVQSSGEMTFGPASAVAVREDCALISSLIDVVGNATRARKSAKPSRRFMACSPA